MGGRLSVSASSCSGDPFVGSATDEPSPECCLRHFRPALCVFCALCSSIGDIEADQVGLCTGCIREHSLAQPTHCLTPLAPGAAFLRAALVALVPLNAAAQHENDGEAAATDSSSSSSAPSGFSGVGKPFSTLPEMGVSQDAASSPPLVDCARHRVLAIQTELDSLATHTEAAFLQLEANRDAALAALESDAVAGVDAQAVLAAFSYGVDTAQASSASKRVGLEAELVAADAALGVAMDATAALSEVWESRS